MSPEIRGNTCVHAHGSGRCSYRWRSLECSARQASPAPARTPRLPKTPPRAARGTEPAGTEPAGSAPRRRWRCGRGRQRRRQRHRRSRSRRHDRHDHGRRDVRAGSRRSGRGRSTAFAEENGIQVIYTGLRDFEAQIGTLVGGRQPPDIAMFPQPGRLAGFATTAMLLPYPTTSSPTSARTGAATG